jgi:hypothetical protein
VYPGTFSTDTIFVLPAFRQSSGPIEPISIQGVIELLLPDTGHGLIFHQLGTTSTSENVLQKHLVQSRFGSSSAACAVEGEVRTINAAENPTDQQILGPQEPTLGVLIPGFAPFKTSSI